jgi:L-Ala-D/L-Glu epimerase
MQIKRIDTFSVRIPLKPERRMITAWGRHDESNYVLVRLETDTGIVGWGEATCTPNWSGETWAGTEFLIERYLAPSVLGVDPANVAEVDRRMDKAAQLNWYAKSAIEMACWDVQGKAVGKPVYELLGGARRPLTIRSRFSMGAYAPDVAAQRAVERVAAGFQTIKVKTGTNPEVDLQRVRAVREAIGPDLDLTIDSNGGWDVDTAIQCVNALKDCNVSWVEQPIPAKDHTGLARIRQETGCRILADEACFDLIEAKELIAHQACDAITIYPGKNGGIRKSKEIVDYAERFGIPCTMGSNLEWDVATAAMVHLIVAAPNIAIEALPGDVLGPDYHELRIGKPPLKIEGPFTSITDAPGLGVSVDEEYVRGHLLKR